MTWGIYCYLTIELDPAKRNVTLALQHTEVLCYNGLRFEFIKVCMGTQRFCWKSQFCLYFVNKIYLPCCCVVFFFFFFLFASSSGPSKAILASYRSVGFHCSGRRQSRFAWPGPILLLGNSICPMSRFAERSHKSKKKTHKNSWYCELGRPVLFQVFFANMFSNRRAGTSVLK